MGSGAGITAYWKFDEPDFLKDSIHGINATYQSTFYHIAPVIPGPFNPVTVPSFMAPFPDAGVINNAITWPASPGLLVAPVLSDKSKFLVPASVQGIMETVFWVRVNDFSRLNNFYFFQCWSLDGSTGYAVDEFFSVGMVVDFPFVGQFEFFIRGSQGGLAASAGIPFQTGWLFVRARVDPIKGIFMALNGGSMTRLSTFVHPNLRVPNMTGMVSIGQNINGEFGDGNGGFTLDEFGLWLGGKGITDAQAANFYNGGRGNRLH
jgi:hypothetical protein